MAMVQTEINESDLDLLLYLLERAIDQRQIRYDTEGNILVSIDEIGIMHRLTLNTVQFTSRDIDVVWQKLINTEARLVAKAEGKPVPQVWHEHDDDADTVVEAEIIEIGDSK